MHIQKKKLAIGTLIIVASTAAVMTFAKGHADRDPAQRFDYIFTQLSLTETQQAEVLSVLAANREAGRDAMKEKMNALKEANPDLSREELRGLMREEWAQQLTDQLNMVLTPDVTEDLVTYMEAHQPKGKGGQRKGKKGDHDDRDDQTDNGSDLTGA